MGKRQQVDSVSPRRRRPGSLAVASALPLVAALAAAGTSAAEPVSSDESQPAVVDNQPATTRPGRTTAQPGMVVDTPFGQFVVPVPQAMADGAHTYLDATVGAIAGLPAGWVFGPAAGATVAASIIAVPAATIGAAVGAVNGYLAPGAPADQSASGIDDFAPVGGTIADESATQE
ncbi:hypothetical protein ACIRRA_22100 [Nocardia sp. NPDC101769]|uniref:hypothetical protein n=1 Tax=Nocardia sp. NPDC101769 TaxID=3364333 RepID=UPI00380E799D